jgi:hypothetical protein
MKTSSQALVSLERVLTRYGNGVAERKAKLIKELARRSLSSSDKVLRFHEALCFLWAYPDNRDVLHAVESALERFANRRDLRRFRDELMNSGIAGTDIHFRFFWFMSRWLARRYPEHLSIDWDEYENGNPLEAILHLLATYSESPGLDEIDFALPDWIDSLKGPGETDAVFLIRRFEALTADAFERETFFEQIDVPMKLSAGPSTPSRTRAKFHRSPVVFQNRPLSTARPSLHDELERPPVGVRDASPREARQLIEMAYEAMVTRTRDLDVFIHADAKDVRIIDCGEGLEFVGFGAQPERRLLLESVYGYLTLKNGVPIGYVLTSQLFQSVGVAYNVFDTYRGTESAVTYGRVLGMVRHMFGIDSVFVDPYQLGHNNQEGLSSGAWWFYYKLGFLPEDSGVRRILRQELARIKKTPRHRSGEDTLQQLTAENMYLYLNGRRDDILGKLWLGNVGLRISRYLAKRFGADRDRGIETCSREVTRLLGVQSQKDFNAGERLAWRRWSPLVLILPGIEKWNDAERRDLAEVVRAKGGRRESDFVRLFDGHRKLRRAIVKLSA